MQEEKQETAEKLAEQPQPSHQEQLKEAPQAQQAQQPKSEEPKSEAASQPQRLHKRGQGERYTDIPNSQVWVCLHWAAMLQI